MVLDLLVQGSAVLHRPRARRLNARDRPARTQVAGQDAELPGKPGGRMEAEQRRAVAFAQRQYRLVAQTLSLLVADVGCQ